MPIFRGSDNLTGVTRYRSGWFGKLILQVEERYIAYWEGLLSPTVKRTPVYVTKWRDARTTDFTELEYIGSKERGENPPPPDKPRR